MVETLALTPALSPGERVNRSRVLWNVARWNWQEVIEQSEDGRRLLPLLGERAGVREVVKYLKARFNDGLEGIYPVEPKRRGGVFLKLLEARTFNAVTINLDFGGGEPRTLSGLIFARARCLRP